MHIKKNSRQTWNFHFWCNFSVRVYRILIDALSRKYLELGTIHFCYDVSKKMFNNLYQLYLKSILLLYVLGILLFCLRAISKGVSNSSSLMLSLMPAGPLYMISEHSIKTTAYRYASIYQALKTLYMWIFIKCWTPCIWNVM